MVSVDDYSTRGFLDETGFQHFAPLLAACQQYAQQSGYRFQAASFRGVARNKPTPSLGHGNSRLAAKIRAAPVVDEFTARVLAGEQGLIEEVEFAHNIIMTESVRSVMMTMCQALDMFPPEPRPAGVDDNDCAYEDVASPLPVIAQRLHNYQSQRIWDSASGIDQLQQRAVTAAFIVDFASEAGMKMPPMPLTQQIMLREFAERTNEYAREGLSNKRPWHSLEKLMDDLGFSSAGLFLHTETQQLWRTQVKHPNSQSQNLLESFLDDLGAGSARQLVQQEAQQWWTTAGTFVAEGAAAFTKASFAKPRESQRQSATWW